MMIREINFDTIESVRKKCITFARDGNKVIKPYKTLYNLDNILNEGTNKNLFLEILKGDYETHFRLWEDIGVICINQGWIHGGYDISELSQCINSYIYLKAEGYLKKLEEEEKRGHYINKCNIEVCYLLGEISLAKHYSEYREKCIAEREIRDKKKLEEAQRKEREIKEKRLEEINSAIEETENKILHQNDFKNIEVDGKSIINKLMEKYSINVPIRTKGWINSKLAMITFCDGKISYKFYGKSQRDNSKVFMKYLIELESFINKKVYCD